jgi:hypothetical protein
MMFQPVGGRYERANGMNWMTLHRPRSTDAPAWVRQTPSHPSALNCGNSGRAMRVETTLVSPFLLINNGHVLAASTCLVQD